jgi:hypothetical protein
VKRRAAARAIRAERLHLLPFRHRVRSPA